MRWSYRIGRVAGTDIKIHVTFPLIVAWWSYAGYLDGGPAAALTNAMLVLGLFACVLFHEFGHILMARRYGVHTPDVILLPIGGVARLERIPEEPKQELLIALAGPAVTLGIVIVLYASQLAGGAAVAPWTWSSIDSFPVYLLVMNVFLLGFNLIPAFPMDGGRVLRAVLARRLGPLRATRIAATVGQMFAVAGGLFGLMNHQPMLALVAVFIFLSAGGELAAVETRTASAGVRVAQMMVTDFRTIPIHATLSQAADLLLAGEQREFPVVDNLGHSEGLLTRDNLIRGLAQLGPQGAVAEAMTANAPAVAPTLGFAEALDQLRSTGLPALPVIDASGTLVGLLTKDNITDLLLVRRSAAAAANRGREWRREGRG